MRIRSTADGGLVMTDDSWLIFAVPAMFLAEAWIGWRMPPEAGWRRIIGIALSCVVAVCGLAAFERDRFEVDVRRGVIRGERKRLWRVTRTEIAVADVTMLVSEHHFSREDTHRYERLRICTAHGSWLPTNVQHTPNEVRALAERVAAAIARSLPLGAPVPPFRLDDDDPPLPHAGGMPFADP